MKKNIFIKRPAMAISISIAMLVAGFISLFTLPVEQYPDIAPPTVYVSTSYTGADADAVQQSVVMPLEEAINGVENMIYMTSSATNDGSAWISVFFKQGTDPDMAAVNVQNRVARAQGLLPAEVTQVGVSTQKRQNSYLKISGLECTNGKYDENFIANYLEINVFPRMKRVEGVGDVQAYSSTYSMRVWLKPDVMAQHELEPQDVTDVINRQSFVAPVGQLGEQSSNAFQYTMKYQGRFSDVEQFNDMVIRAEQDGNVLRLKDVADVELGASSYNFKGIINGHPGVNFMIYPVSGVNMTEVNRNISDLMDEISETLPEGLRFVTFMDTNDFLFESIHEVVETLVIAIILVILVVYFFLQDFKSTLIPSLSIIVSLVGTFACLLIAGFSINILTLFALVLAIGTVVDDAIVVVEAVQSKFDAGYKSPYLATRDAMGDVTMAVISCTLVFMAVFVPVTFTGGTAGIFYTQFGVTMATSVGLSMVSALILCPALCALLMRPSDGTKSAKSFNGRVRAAYNASYNALLGKYKRGVMFFFRRRWIAWSSLVVATVLLVFLLSTMRTGLVPQEDKGLIAMSISASPGTSLEDMGKIMDRIEAIVKEQPEMAEYCRTDGFGGGGTGSCYGTFYVNLKGWSEREGKEHSIDAVINRLNARFADIKEASIFVMQDGMIPGYGNGNAIDLNLQDRTGGDTRAFYDITQNFLSELNARKEIAMAYSSYAINFPQYEVQVDAAKCERVGVSPQHALEVLGNFSGAAYISNFNKFGKVYRVMLQASPEYRMDEFALRRMFVRTNDGMAPLSQFVTLKKANGPELANRFNLFSSIASNINVAEGYSSGEAMNAVREVAARTLPTGYTYEYGGISREEAGQSGTNTVVIYALCVLLIYLILVCLYESFLVPMAVILSVPFGLMGSFLFATLFGLENNIYLQTGVIMLIGLLAKTAILITEYASERRRKGMGIVEAAYSAAIARFRPILMTVMTMIIGMLPLVFATGAGANGNNTLGVGVVGGLLTGTIALLVTVPVFFIVFQYLQERYVRSPRHEHADLQVETEHNRYLASQSAFNPKNENEQ